MRLSTLAIAIVPASAWAIDFPMFGKDRAYLYSSDDCKGKKVDQFYAARDQRCVRPGNERSMDMKYSNQPQCVVTYKRKDGGTFDTNAPCGGCAVQVLPTIGTKCYKLEKADSPKYEYGLVTKGYGGRCAAVTMCPQADIDAFFAK